MRRKANFASNAFISKTRNCANLERRLMISKHKKLASVPESGKITERSSKSRSCSGQREDEMSGDTSAGEQIAPAT
jgi:hypothetical protein